MNKKQTRQVEELERRILKKYELSSVEKYFLELKPKNAWGWIKTLYYNTLGEILGTVYAISAIKNIEDKEIKIYFGIMGLTTLVMAFGNYKTFIKSIKKSSKKEAIYNDAKQELNYLRKDLRSNFHKDNLIEHLEYILDNHDTNTNFYSDGSALEVYSILAKKTKDYSDEIKKFYEDMSKNHELFDIERIKWEIEGIEEDYK